jgi:hypothetical protein
MASHRPTALLADGVAELLFKAGPCTATLGGQPQTSDARIPQPTDLLARKDTVLLPLLRILGDLLEEFAECLGSRNRRGGHVTPR